MNLRSKLLCVRRCERTSQRFESFRSFDAAYEGSVFRVYVEALYIATYIYIPADSPLSARIRGEILPSARNIAENYSGIVRKIRARPRGYPRPPAPENRGIRRKNVSYPCQVPYVRTSVSFKPTSFHSTSAANSALTRGSVVTWR